MEMVADDGTKIYISNFGWHGYFMGFVSWWSGNRAAKLVHVYRFAFGAALACEYGLFAGLFIVGGVAMTWQISVLVMNLYWGIVFNFLPFVVGWFLYPYCYKKSKIWLYTLILGALVALKSMTGCEYITTVSLSTAIPIFHKYLKGKVRLRELISRSLSVGVISVILVSGIIFHHIDCAE